MSILQHGKMSLLLASLALTPLTAQADDEYWNGDRLYLRLGTFFVNNANSTIRLDSETAIGITLDSAQDLGMNRSDNIARFEGLFRINRTHSIGLQWYDLKRSGSINARREIEVGDPPETIPIGARVDSYLNTEIFKLSYNYSFYHNEKVELAVGAGLHIMKIAAGVEGELNAGDETGGGAVDSVSVTAPLPVVGAKVGYYITPEVRWVTSVDLFFISILDYDGQFIDTSVDVEWLFSKYVGVGTGINLNSLGLRGSPETDNRFRLTNTISGIQLYVFSQF